LAFHHVTDGTATRFDFSDSAAYERFVGRWGRAAGREFLAWLDPPAGADWLDVGCGTGLFTELICETRRPSAVVAIDHASAQIEHAKHKPVARQANFRIADAQALPFASSTFDIVVSALVINFIPDRSRALREMQRVARPGGVVGGYVWDFMSEFSPSGPFRLGMKDVLADVPALPGAEDSQLNMLRLLFQRAGLGDIVTRTIEVSVEFPDFEAFWIAQTPSYAPTTRMVADLPERTRLRLIEAIRARIRTSPSGQISYSACANAISARVPKAGHV
jgi:ubiquinone/menaquinone biosynthesis C-methylase UbiE